MVPRHTCIAESQLASLQSGVTFISSGRRPTVRAGAIQAEANSRVNFSGNTLFKFNVAGGVGGEKGKLLGHHAVPGC